MVICVEIVSLQKETYVREAHNKMHTETEKRIAYVLKRHEPNPIHN